MALALVSFGTSAEQVKEKYYTNCQVADVVDDFTDEVSHGFACSSTEGINTTEMNFLVSDYLAMGVKTGWTFSMDDSVNVKIRVDKNSVVSGSWHLTDGGHAVLFNDVLLFNSLLKQLAAGNRVTIQVGDEKGSIPLKGSARAIADFKQRIAHLNLIQ